MKAREYAVECLQRILFEGAYASLLMRSTGNRLPEKEMSLASELIYGTLRNYSYLEFQWRDLVKRSPKPKTALLLDISIYQLQFLDRLPDYAVVDEAVDLCDKGEKGFVNALLRKVIARGRYLPDNLPPLEKCALETSHPLWLLKMWKAHYGEETAMAIAAFDQTRSTVYGRANFLKISREELERDPAVHFINDVSFTYEGNLLETEWFRWGRVLIQDVSSAMIPQMMDLQPGMKVLDCCSAPGTKAQEIAMLMRNEGEITACDLYPERVELIDTLMKRTGVEIVRTRVIDGTKENAEKELYDRILIDAPCSGLGDLRHKPEIRYHLKPENIDLLTATQSQILAANCGSLKEDGLLVYSTCTLNKKENETQIRKFLQLHPEFTLEKEETRFPHLCMSDGFYIAVLRKKAGFMVE